MKMTAAELAAEKERQRAQDAVHEERRYMSARMGECKLSFLFVCNTVDYSNIKLFVLSETKTQE
jgi:predicted dithiol-disulfide oxidoreductase (DUF899 family)